MLRGDNNLDTCFQYCVKDCKGDKLLVVKAYDKIQELVARDGSHLVGSRIRTILGSTKGLGLFEKRIRKAQNTGMTRLEVSICSAALEKFRPDLPSMRTLWHSKMQAAMDLLTAEVLNHRTVIPQVYRRLSVPSLLGRIGGCMDTMMIIGKRSTWMVNARSSNDRRFIGTKQLIGLPLKCVNVHLW